MEDWLLIVIIIVNQYSGKIDERGMRPIKQENEIVCNLEAKAVQDQLTNQLGGDTYTRFDNQGLPNEVRLGGTLTGFSVGCVQRGQKDWSFVPWFDPNYCNQCPAR